MSTDSSQTTRPISELSYEDARDELVAIVARIEGGNASLEESMELWERGEALAAHCKAKLDQAQQQLDRAAPGGAGDGADPETVAGADRGTVAGSKRGAVAGETPDEDDPADD